MPLLRMTGDGRQRALEWTRRVCLVVLLGLLYAIGTADQVNIAQSVTSVTRGPYLQVGTPTDVTVRWRTDVPTDSQVQYGTTPGTLTSAESDATVTTEHEITLSSLTPDTTYYYAVGTSTAVLAGDDPDHFFLTAPPSGTDKPTRLWVLGDSGTANANARSVRDAYLAHTGPAHTDLWLMLGDNAYPDGTDAEYQAAVFDMYPTMLRKSVLWPTLGNHDGHTADSATQSGPYYDIFTLPTNGEAGGLASGTEAYYSFDYGDIHFVSLNSIDVDRSTSGPMMTWLENDLAFTDKQWIIAFWHYPPYSKGSHDSDTSSSLTKMRENALPILEALGVDLVLTGDSHSYERSFLIDRHYGTSDTLTAGMILDGGDGREDGDGAYSKTGGFAPNDGAVYVVAGSSGQISGGSLDHPVMYISLNLLGSLVLDINGSRLDAAFVDPSGTVSDHFTIIKGPDIFPPTLLSAEAVGNNTTVRVAFSERLDVSSAENPGNYAIDNAITVIQARLAPDGRTIALTTSPLIEGLPYTLTVNNVSDLAGNPIDSNTQTTFTFVNSVTMQAQVAATADDAEEDASGGMSMSSSDLELIYDKGEQTVGIRFAAVGIPAGATILDASMQFQVDEPSSDATALTIEGEATDHALPFSSSNSNISSRPRTMARVRPRRIPPTRTSRPCRPTASRLRY